MNFSLRVPRSHLAVLETSSNLLMMRLADYRIVDSGRQYGRHESARGSDGVHVLAPGRAVEIIRQTLWREERLLILNNNGTAHVSQLAVWSRRPWRLR